MPSAGRTGLRTWDLLIRSQLLQAQLETFAFAPYPFQSGHSAFGLSWSAAVGIAERYAEPYGRP